MKKFTIFLLIAVLVLSLSACGKTEKNAGGDNKGTPTNSNTKETEVSDEKVGTSNGEKAPGFELTNLKGESVSLESFKGKPVHLVVWSIGCPHCVKELEDLAPFYKENGDKCVLLTVNATMQDGEDRVKSFMEEKGYDFEVLKLEGEGGTKFLDDYRIGPIPHNFFIDKDGMMKDSRLGRIPMEDFKPIFDSLVGE